ncbi:DUF47 family protein [Candidatus Bathyarchaeota archaeon]|nr:DUF47 family protein [Candidatus Bathyarchaeota archaeon]
MEAEPRAKRRALSLCQDHLRKVIEVARKTIQMIDAFIAGDEPSITRLHDEIEKLGEEVMDSKRNVTRDLVEIGAILLNREDFLRFTYIISEIADLYKGISFRLLVMFERKWFLPQIIKEGIAELSEAVFTAMMKLREAVFILGYSSPQIFEKAREVEVAEKRVDNIYRKLEILLLEQDLNVSTMLLVRDVIQLLEDTADKIEDASDAVRILALAI